jgi:hypothetical protein
MSTIEEEKARLRHEWGKRGTKCRACTQTVALRRRAFNAGMARALIVMYREHGRAFQKKTETLRGVGSAARDEGQLRYWGLLEEEKSVRPDGGRKGVWRVTEKGEAFIQCRVRVHSHAYTFNSQCFGLDGDMITIREALGKKFNLEELLRGI